MRIAIVLFFLALPLLELAVLIKVGQWIGFWWTMLILVGTAIGGGLIVHEQGFGALRRAQAAISAGRLPVEPVVDGVFLMIAGALLLTPGLITDSLGGLLLVPPLRRAFSRWVFGRILSNADVHVRTSTHGRSGEESQSRQGPRPDGPRRDGDGIVIDGEWERIDDPKPGTQRPDAGNKPQRPR